MDALNRVRFAGDGERLAAWTAASSIPATPVKTPVEEPLPEPEPVDGEVKPAA
jgi:hypothetical protein